MYHRGHYGSEAPAIRLIVMRMLRELPNRPRAFDVFEREVYRLYEFALRKAKRPNRRNHEHL